MNQQELLEALYQAMYVNNFCKQQTRTPVVFTLASSVNTINSVDFTSGGKIVQLITEIPSCGAEAHSMTVNIKDSNSTVIFSIGSYGKGTSPVLSPNIWVCGTWTVELRLAKQLGNSALDIYVTPSLAI